MRNCLFLLIFFFFFVSHSFGQQKDSLKINRCHQYDKILKFISDTSNLKYYRNFGENIKEIIVDFSYKHFALRQEIDNSFKHYLKDSSILYKSISPKKNNRFDSLVFSNDFKDNTCISVNKTLKNKSNLKVLFDRYNENIVFVFTRFIRKGESFGSTFIFWFDNSERYTYKEVNFVE